MHAVITQAGRHCRQARVCNALASLACNAGGGVNEAGDERRHEARLQTVGQAFDAGGH